jgi:hypothetical protein
LNDGVGVNDPVRGSAIADIGGGDFAVVAATPAELSSPTPGTASWRLIIIDSETLDFVEARGVIASMYYDRGSYENSGQSISITVITPQIKDTEGAITTQAVLLATVASGWSDAMVQLSTDGGITWETIRTGALHGDTFYIGNKLHPVKIGIAL